MIAQRPSLCHCPGHHDPVSRCGACAQRRTVPRMCGHRGSHRGLHRAFRLPALFAVRGSLDGARAPAVGPAHRAPLPRSHNRASLAVTVTDTASLPQVGRQQCPTCDAQVAKAATLTERFVYLRCQDCGEVWAIPERRAFPRPRSPGDQNDVQGPPHIAIWSDTSGCIREASLGAAQLLGVSRRGLIDRLMHLYVRADRAHVLRSLERVGPGPRRNTRTAAATEGAAQGRRPDTSPRRQPSVSRPGDPMGDPPETATRDQHAR